MKKIRKKILLVLVAALFLIPSIALLLENTAQAGTQTFVVPDETKPLPVNLINGSFESPYTANVIYPASGSAGWFTSTGANLEIQRVGAQSTFATTQADGPQYTELNNRQIYQDVSTTPGSRVLWRFAHRARGYSTTVYDVMNFIIRKTGTTTNLLRVTASDRSTAWGWYKGLYTIPAGQTSTNVRFNYVSSYNSTDGNFIDAVVFATGAKLIAKKSISTSAADNATAAKGEVVTITIAITNWGETDASYCVFRDVLSDGLSYVAGSARINGVAAGTLATFNSTTDELRINYGANATAGTARTNGGVVRGSQYMGTSGTTGQGQTITLSFQATVTGSAGYVVRNQASTTYNDYGWESYNASDFRSYSSVTGRTLSSSDQTTYVNEFLIVGSSVSGRVWADQSAEGALDAYEVRLSGIPVTLYAATDTTFSNPLLTTTTLADGTYTFSGLAVGTYQVAITTPSFYYISPLANDNDAVVNGTRAVVTPINIGSNVSITNKDIGLVPYSPDISGRIWMDEDADGTIDATETKLSGLLVGLYLSTDTTYSSPVRTTTTDASGGYIFPQLNPGNYKVAALTPDGYFVTILANDNKAVAEGTRAVISGLTISMGSISELDIGFLPYSNSVSGKVWYDTNWDGNIETEQGIEDETVWLFLSTDTNFIDPILTTTTNADGSYTFSGFAPGSYTVATVTPSGCYVTIPGDNNAVANGGRAVITGLTFGNNTTIANQDIGFAQYKSISGRVFYDLDQDGMIDTTDTPYTGATVTLYLVSDTTFSTPATDVYGNPLVSLTLEDEEGEGYACFYFPNVPNAVYTAVMTTPSGYQVTLKTASTDNDAVANDTRAVITGLDLSGGNPSLSNVDFGFRYNPVTLTITKRVTGDLADANQTFSIQVRLQGVTTTLSYTGASTVAGVSAPANGTIGSGFGTVTLKHGQSITIQGIPYGTFYQISETLIFSGYSVTITEQNGNPTTQYGSTGVSSTLISNGSLLFTNAKTGVVPTGILMATLPFVLIAVLTIGALALTAMLMRKRKREKQR